MSDSSQYAASPRTGSLADDERVSVWFTDEESDLTVDLGGDESDPGRGSTVGSFDGGAEQEARDFTVGSVDGGAGQEAMVSTVGSVDGSAGQEARVSTIGSVDGSAGQEAMVAPIGSLDGSAEQEGSTLRLTVSRRYPNGYQFPAKHTWNQSLEIGRTTYIRFLRTPFGILVTVWALNVVAWGAMIFFLLVGAASRTMCFVQEPQGSSHYIHDCNDVRSSRQIWMEVDSQVLTALFCVTAFGLAPWRFRDLFYLLKWRVFRRIKSLRRLAAWHRNWVRLPGSEQLDPLWKTCISDLQNNLNSFPEPVVMTPEPPLTSVRAAPTSSWKLDFVVWCAALNTFSQIVLCYFMWGVNRFKRPHWATWVFVSVGFVSAGLGKMVQVIEGKRIKGIEGIPLGVDQIDAIKKVSRQDSGTAHRRTTEV